MKIAYLVLAHKDPKFLSILCDELGEFSDVFVHVNKNVEIAPFKEELQQAKFKDHIFLADNRVSVHWGGFSILKATFTLLRDALNSSVSYDRFILITGEDFPIKSIAYLNDFFKDNKENYICARQVDKKNNWLVNYKHYRDCKIISMLMDCLIRIFPNFPWFKRKIPFEYKNTAYYIYGESPKWAITRECAEFVYSFYCNNEKFNKYFMFSHAPDDFYFATVVMNSRLKETVNNKQNLFYVHWMPNQGAKTLDLDDYDDIVKSAYFFGKRFSSEKSLDLIKKLKELK